MGCGFCCVVPGRPSRGGRRAARAPPPGRRGDRPGHGPRGRRRAAGAGAGGPAQARGVRRRAGGVEPEPDAVFATLTPISHSSTRRTAQRPAPATPREPPQLGLARAARAGRRPPPPRRWPAGRSGAAPQRASGRRLARRRLRTGLAIAAARQAVVAALARSRSAAAGARRCRSNSRTGSESTAAARASSSRSAPNASTIACRAQVDPEALHVQPGRARLLHQRLGGVELAAEAHEPLAHRAQVALRRLGALLRGGLDRHAGRDRSSRSAPCVHSRGSIGMPESAAASSHSRS